MPVLDALPHLTIIRGLKGILDFYYWKGVPCVRKWPVIPPSSRSPASMRSAHLFGAIVAAYSLLGAVLKELFALDATDQTRTARDLFVSAVLGHLHDHNMSDFLDLLTEATAYLDTLKDIANALQSAATDRLLVRGEDQIFTYQDIYKECLRNTNTDAGENNLESSPVGPGEICVITGFDAVPWTEQVPRITAYWIGSSARNTIRSKLPVPQWDALHYDGQYILAPTHYIQIRFYGCAAAQTIGAQLWGYKMTLET